MRTSSATSAFINGAHAQQILLHELGPRKASRALFSRGRFSVEEVMRLATAFQELLVAPSKLTQSGAQGEEQDAGNA